MTEKQKRIVSKIIQHLGQDKVEDYLHNLFVQLEQTSLSKEQAQKIITGLYHKVPRKPIYKVYGRDVF